MGCLNNNTWQGGCTIFDPNSGPDENLGCDEKGNCLVENDEAPMDSCTYYESDGDDEDLDDDDIEEDDIY